MDKRLREQVERIMDEGRGDYCDVIVRMKSLERDDHAEALLTTAAAALRRRSLSTTARECLPAAKGPVETVRPTGGGRVRATVPRQTVPGNQSMADQIDGAGADPTLTALRSAGLKALDPLIKSAFILATASPVNVVAAHSKDDRRGDGGEGGSRHEGARDAPPVALPTGRRQSIFRFWTSKSAVFQVPRDEVPNLPKEVPQIGDIYPNRVLRVPRVVEAKRLPDKVKENKVSSWGVQAINALAAWGAFGVRGRGVTIGLLDTGVEANHPDLKGKVKAWAEFDAGGKRVRRSAPRDSDMHGTHCAGTICGGNASGKYIGVAPGARLACALVLDGKNGGTDAQVLAGIEWAIEQRVDVISMSLGGHTIGPEPPSTYTAAILNALRLGIPVVTAIGNEGSQTSGSPGNDLFSFSVGATDVDDNVAGFSGGLTQVVRDSRFLNPRELPLPYSKPDVSAPGVGILSSVPGGRWEALNGTSMATPHVAGALALLLSATRIRSRTPTEERAFLLQDLLTGSVEELGETGQNHRFGFGRIDVLRAIGFARELGY